MTDLIPYNPLDKANLGASVAEALLGRTPRPLAELESFTGAGLYALYYRGDAQPYRKLALLNAQADPCAPIYVGKAVPAGARKGGLGDEIAKSKALFKRLNEHADSIRATKNLKIEDFSCRFLLVDDIWIPLGESLLITKFTPIWNSLIDGFGNHDPGRGRYEGLVPRWDVLHPGRPWAERCRPRTESAEEIAREVVNFLDANLPPLKPHFYLEQVPARYEV